MKKKNEYTRDEWIEISSMLSDEKDGNEELLSRFAADDNYETVKNWKELKEMNNDKEINVDKAWNRLYSRLDREGLMKQEKQVISRFSRYNFIRIAAAVIVVMGLASVLLYLNDKGILSRKIIVATTENQKNLQVSLPDGSTIYLNRNTRLSYNHDFGKKGRHVDLEGEAFFEISPDSLKPFTVDAGKAIVKVIGTTFSVLSNNTDSAVEVFVKSGKVMLSSSTSSEDLILDPGFVGTMNAGKSAKTINDDPNYLSWNTGLLFYNGQKLDIVFKDLKKVYNMDIVADDPGILENTWTSPIDNQPQETIIRLICISFNLGYTKDGNVYHLTKK